jgi:hypothetical protein
MRTNRSWILQTTVTDDNHAVPKQFLKKIIHQQYIIINIAYFTYTHKKLTKYSIETIMQTKRQKATPPTNKQTKTKSTVETLVIKDFYIQMLKQKLTHFHSEKPTIITKVCLSHSNISVSQKGTEPAVIQANQTTEVGAEKTNKLKSCQIPRL